MAANSLAANIGQLWKPMVEDFLENSLMARKISNVQYLTSKDGNTVNFPYTNPQTNQIYTPGTDLSISAVSGTQSSLTVDTFVASTMVYDIMQESQVTSEWLGKQVQNAAYTISNRIDQDVLSTGVTNAFTGNTVTGGTLSSSTIYAALTDAMANLQSQSAINNTPYVVVDPYRWAILSQGQLANTFAASDRAWMGGLASKDVAGFEVYVSNNLPQTVALTIAATPTAGDTITVAGVTFTFRANGTAATAGDISLGTGGTALADTQANVRAALNGTGTPGASTYIDVPAYTRAQFLTNRRVSLSAFQTNVATLTGVNLKPVSVVFTSGSNTLGTLTMNLLAGVKGATALGLSKDITLQVTDEPKQFAKNYLTGAVYGQTVFHNDTFRLAKITCNA